MVKGVRLVMGVKWMEGTGSGVVVCSVQGHSAAIKE